MRTGWGRRGGAPEPTGQVLDPGATTAVSKEQDKLATTLFGSRHVPSNARGMFCGKQQQRHTRCFGRSKTTTTRQLLPRQTGASRRLAQTTPSTAMCQNRDMPDLIAADAIVPTQHYSTNQKPRKSGRTTQYSTTQGSQNTVVEPKIPGRISIKEASPDTHTGHPSHLTKVYSITTHNSTRHRHTPDCPPCPTSPLNVVSAGL